MTICGQMSTWYSKTRCVCETQMPPIMANSKEGQDHKEIYFDTSGKIWSQEMMMCDMEALIGMTNVNFLCFELSIIKVKKLHTNRKIL